MSKKENKKPWEFLSIILRHEENKMPLAFIETNARVVMDIISEGRAIWVEPKLNERIDNDPWIKGMWMDTFTTLMMAIGRQKVGSKEYPYEGVIYNGNYEDWLNDEEAQEEYNAARVRAGYD